jgi:hypothetical protein
MKKCRRCDADPTRRERSTRSPVLRHFQGFPGKEMEETQGWRATLRYILRFAPHQAVQGFAQNDRPGGRRVGSALKTRPAWQTL